MHAQERARELLSEILSREEFARAEEGLLQRLAAAIKANLPGIISGPGLFVALIISFAAIAVFTGLLIWIMRRYSLATGARRAESALEGGKGTPRAALAASRDAAGKGSHKEAIRLLLLALLLQLDEEGALEYHYSRTNGEYLRQLRLFPARLMAAELFSLYEKIWYGGSRCRREDYDRSLRLYSAILERGQ